MSAELYQACREGDVATVQAFLARGVNVNAKYLYSDFPLKGAVFGNNIEMLRILLARDDLDIAATDSGYTALHFACAYGYAECIALIGQDRRMTSNIINIKNNCGVTPLMEAVKNNQLSSVQRMAELDGVDWETKNEAGESLEDVARWVFLI